ncbi:MAG: rutA 5 [Actinomycetia bacterium]|nr:rutA 5 [Actinomycetes bacterium]
MRFWVSTAFTDPCDLLEVARAADQAGYHGAFAGDHLIHPKDLRSAYPYSPHPDGRPVWEPETPWPDAWVLIGAMAAVTEQLHLSNAIYVAGARPLLQVAKQVATASVLSGGRVALGVGAGWMREEFELMGQSFDDRGPRLSEMMDALRALWQGGWVEWHGAHYDVPALMMEPHPEVPVPIWSGGHTDAALRRAARHADGWIGSAYPWDEAVHHVGRIKACLAEEGRADDPFEIIMAFYEPPTVDLYRRAEDLGVTATMCKPWAGATDGYRPALERFAEAVVRPCR